MDLRITQTRPQIGIETQRARLEMQNNGKLDFRLSHTEPQLQMQSKGPKIHIDQTQAFADANLKGISDFAAEYVQLGKQQAMEYIAQKAQEGDRLANIQSGGRPIVEMARESMIEQVDFNIGLMPEHGPDISVEEAELNIELIPGQVNIEQNDVPIDITFIPGQVNVYMLQNPALNIEYVGRNVDTKI